MGVEQQKSIFQNKIEKNQMGRGVRKKFIPAVKIVEKSNFHKGWLLTESTIIML